MEKVVATYIKLRDRKEALEAEVKEAIKPINEKLDLIEAAMMKYMQEQGLENIKTKAGTAYQSKVNSVKVEDWESVKSFIQENQAWDILNRAVNKTAVMGEYNGQVPGVSIQTINKLNFRRS